MGLLTRPPCPTRPGVTAGRACGLVPFEAHYSGLVAGWVRSDDELFLLSPRTPGPLTPAKVIGWKQAGGDQLLYCIADDAEPWGYVELNPIPGRTGQWWVGHCLVAPYRRGKGIGLRMVRLVLDLAFDSRGATAVSLVVFPHNFGAVRCYRVAGFAERREVYREFATRPGRHRMLYMSIDRHRYRSLGIRSV